MVEEAAEVVRLAVAAAALVEEVKLHHSLYATKSRIFR